MREYIDEYSGYGTDYNGSSKDENYSPYPSNNPYSYSGNYSEVSSPVSSPASATPTATQTVNAKLDAKNLTLGELLNQLPKVDETELETSLVATGGKSAGGSGGSVILILLVAGAIGFFIWRKYGR